ncbi:hypothetical protein [Shewanella pealeana]|uniref:Uncharacterized protein n=1 Tax=Shewanella pealeana (strain ATCC 700345 / ANG-SQ1) TaxID=398579 RepID=A8H051_SHEPA|nr:hypothetical protein [Shewanella pealeana]ABV85938.1 hypothetical protein Spea_0610 [Shewanella pealeana ATCC 700345]
MNNVSMVAKAVGLALVVAVSSPVLAAETENATASVTVKNAFEMVVAKPLNFGEITAVVDLTDTDGVSASITMSPNPTEQATVVNGAGNLATIRSLVPGEPGEVTVAGVAPYSELSVTLPAGTTNVVASAAAPGSPKFVLSAITAYITSGDHDGTLYADANKLTADGQGNASFNFGGTLTTDVYAADTNVIDRQYQDGEFSGSFPITVSY